MDSPVAEQCTSICTATVWSRFRVSVDRSIERLYFATKTNNTLCHYVLLYVAIYTNITVYAVAAGRRSIYKAQEHLRKDTNASSNIEL